MVKTIKTDEAANVVSVKLPSGMYLTAMFQCACNGWIWFNFLSGDKKSSASDCVSDPADIIICDCPDQLDSTYYKVIEFSIKADFSCFSGKVFMMII